MTEEIYSALEPKNILVWLESRVGDEYYDYCSSDSCCLAQYLKEKFPEEKFVVDPYSVRFGKHYLDSINLLDSVKTSVGLFHHQIPDRSELPEYTKNWFGVGSFKEVQRLLQKSSDDRYSDS